MTTEDLEELKASQAGAYITKSSTLEKREGNPLPRYVDLELGSINSMGLPNLGFDYYLDYVLKNQKEKAQEAPIFFSIAGAECVLVCVTVLVVAIPLAINHHPGSLGSCERCHGCTDSE